MRLYTVTVIIIVIVTNNLLLTYLCRRVSQDVQVNQEVVATPSTGRTAIV